MASSEIVRCRQVTPTGSHLPKTICTSAAERDVQAQEGRVLLEERQRRQAAEQAMRESIRRDTPIRP